MGERPMYPGTSREPRTGVIAPVRIRYHSILDFAETQSINISRSGMFIATSEVFKVGNVVEFEFILSDGFALLKGAAEVVRLSNDPPGMGVKFLQLDGGSKSLIERIVDVNIREGKRPTVGSEFINPDSAGAMPAMVGDKPIGDGVAFAGRTLQVQITPATAGYFVYNPLLNIRLGGFVVPGIEDAPLGTLYDVALVSLDGRTLFKGKGKVVAKHEQRLGIRLVDVDKITLSTLQGEVAKMAPAQGR